MITVVCVYRTGGDYTAEYVHRLYRSLMCNAMETVNFVCLTDSDEDVPGKRPLTYNWPGWWSKLEVFEIEGPCVYFDLDTVFVGGLDMLFTSLNRRVCNDSIYMLTPFNAKRREAGLFASGIMAWSGDWRFITRSYCPDKHVFDGDQDYINYIIREDNRTINPISNLVDGVYSYKWHCLGGMGVPADARIICFHGKPRPHEVNWGSL
jgi:hypothetical protein